MQSKPNGRICVQTNNPIKPIDRNVWRIIGFLLKKHIAFSSGEYDGLQVTCENKTLFCPRNENNKKNDTKIMEFTFKNKTYLVSSTNAIRIRQIGEKYFITEDIFTPIINYVNLVEETENLFRDRYGLFIGSKSSRAMQGQKHLFVDLIAHAARLLGDLFGISVREINPKVPYIVALTFDVDGFFPGQPQKVIEFLKRWQVIQPTFMVMATDKDELTIYDPEYNLEDPSLKSLWDSDSEIGLHSSYLAHDDYELLMKQKERLEKTAGRLIYGHRSHYYRFAYPRSWGQQLRAGFLYDASLGYPDTPGNRNGTNIPVPFPDPDGFERKLWTISTTCLDQHFFDPNSYLFWEGKGKENIDLIFDNIQMNGGIITLDWHVHVIDNPSFPNHFKPLEYMLERASSDGALITGLGKIVKSMDEEWDRLFADLKWSLKEGVFKTNSKNQDEIATYTNIFSNQNLGATSIDTAIMSFLSVLPNDAETILDIGCGPGLMSRRIPPFHKVLCMDIDEEIILPITKPKCLGDITNIPLEDKCVDLAMACDVIEHLTDDDIHKAISELERVSRKYIYLQVPFSESLAAGQIKCPNCENVWHVNHHKQSFTLKRLFNLLSSKWVPKTVNFTGDIIYFDIPPNYYGLKESLGQSNLSTDGINCASCGHTLKGINETHNDQVFKEITRFSSRLTPRYSEVGILFEFDGEPLKDIEPVVRTRSGQAKAIPKPIVIQENILDFSKPFVESNSYSSFEQIPILIPHQVAVIRETNKIRIVKSELAKNASISMAFPMILNCGDTIKVKGYASDKLELTFLGYSSGDNEFVISVNLVHNDFFLEIIIPPEMEKAKGFIRIIWCGGSELNLYSVEVSNNNPNRLFYTFQGSFISEFSHIEKTKDGILYRWALPYDNLAFFSEELDQWIEKAHADESPKEDYNNILFQHIKFLMKQISFLEKELHLKRIEVEKNKLIQSEVEGNIGIPSINLHDHGNVGNKESIELELLGKTQQLEAQLHDALQCIIVLEDKINNLRLEYEQKNLMLDNQLQNAMEFINLLEEKVIPHKSNFTIKNKDNFRARLIRIIKQICKRLIILIKRYPLLISIGDLLRLRRIYHKLKLRGWV
ncbi:methyltransferase domain-containing protein [Desulforamulus ferrireducens]|uniref:Methyltransferase type 11 domain-containing protein n=1 Tax=Desulforamulus ferrireducens TaxID=1833852 RepID=A0A1S6IZZ9_9FIRM|nr:methyltransferase domain-containing protein [Desulforamulus ferrireducens]AQS60357.1 hypothetical protein B0537_15560 [Desulforamulus ferrireducens]